VKARDDDAIIFAATATIKGSHLAA